jgi:hypothetical protein
MKITSEKINEIAQELEAGMKVYLNIKQEKPFFELQGRG